jgi:hypothetical protein
VLHVGVERFVEHAERLGNTFEHLSIINCGNISWILVWIRVG